MRNENLRTFALAAATALMFPVLTGAKGGCGGPINSKSPAPDVSGTWDLAWDDTLDVEITLGGAVHKSQIGSRGGRITIDHDGHPLSFDLDCERPDVVCPSEVWPASVGVEQRNAEFPHRMFVMIPTQTCLGSLATPEPAACGPDTNNPDCDAVCDGEVKTQVAERFGVINEAGSRFDLVLGAGIASNGINCALLGVSSAHAGLVTRGSGDDGDWTADEMSDGEVRVAYAGGCLWAGDPDSDGELDAVVLGATVKLTTGFSGTRSALE